MTLSLCALQFLLDTIVLLRMLIMKGKILQFRLNLIQSQAVSQRRIDIECLAGNLILLVGRLRCQGTHVVQTVANLDEDDTDVLAHGQQQLLEVLCLCGSLFTKDATADFCQSVYYLCYLGTEDVGQVFASIVSILHHIVQQGCADARRAQSNFLAGYLCNGNGVHDVWLARQSANPFMGLSCKVESLGDDIHLLTMARGQITVQQALESVIHQFLVSVFTLHHVLIHKLLSPPSSSPC